MIFLDYTVARIKNSAKITFYEKGFYGTRIQEIANNADVSKSLLHYYFRTKEHLFKIIIHDSIKVIIKQMSPILKTELNFFELIDEFIRNVLILFKDDKRLLSFIINEYNQNFQIIKSELNPIYNFFKEFEHKISVQSQKEKIKIKDTKHLIINIISLCGWQVIGINIFDLGNIIHNQSYKDMDMVEVKNKIYENVVTSLES